MRVGNAFDCQVRSLNVDVTFTSFFQQGIVSVMQYVVILGGLRLFSGKDFSFAWGLWSLYFYNSRCI